MKLVAFGYHCPETLEEVLELLADDTATRA
jgi:hypothetical protein